MRIIRDCERSEAFWDILLHSTYGCEAEKVIVHEIAPFSTYILELGQRLERAKLTYRPLVKYRTLLVDPCEASERRGTLRQCVDERAYVDEVVCGIRITERYLDAHIQHLQPEKALAAKYLVEKGGCQTGNILQYKSVEQG